MTFHFIPDASFLICMKELEEIELLNLVILECNNFIITQEVMAEVRDISDIVLLIENIKKFHTGYNCSSKSISDYQNPIPNLGLGELSVISCYFTCGKTSCCAILDDDKSRKKARSLGLTFHGTIWFIEECYKKGHLGKEKAIMILKKIGKTEFYIDQKILDEAIARIQDS